MKLSEIVAPDTRLFVKSEFGPAGNHWPALSFSSHKVAADFRAMYRPGIDFVIYVGTGDPESTEMPEHRQRLLSVVSVEPRAPISTKDLVPGDVWDRTVQKWGLRWEWSLPLVAAYDVAEFPRAHDTIPELYRSLGTLQNLGRCVEAQGPEYTRLASLEIVEVPLNLSQRAQRVLNLNSGDVALRYEISRLMDGIKQDIRRAGLAKTGVYPLRTMPNDSDLFQTLMRRWHEQQGICALCAKPIPLKPTNRLLQMSRDRTDSDNKAYDWENTRLTHLACNLGKSDATLDEWHGYLAMVRQTEGSGFG
jgi:hypothetical protein